MSPYDGICGMSLKKLSGDEDLIMETLYEEGLVKSKVFSFYLNTADKDSYLYFGGYEESFGEFVWMDVDN